MAMIDSFISYLENSQIHFERAENSINFEQEGLHYVYLYNPDDPTYFRLMLPRLVEINEKNNNRLLEISLGLATKYKVGKVIRFENNLWLSFEVFILSFDIDNSFLFKRAIRILKLMFEDMRSQISEQG